MLYFPSLVMSGAFYFAKDKYLSSIFISVVGNAVTSCFLVNLSHSFSTNPVKRWSVVFLGSLFFCPRGIC